MLCFPLVIEHLLGLQPWVGRPFGVVPKRCSAACGGAILDPASHAVNLLVVCGEQNDHYPDLPLGATFVDSEASPCRETKVSGADLNTHYFDRSTLAQCLVCIEKAHAGIVADRGGLLLRHDRRHRLVPSIVKTTRE